MFRGDGPVTDEPIGQCRWQAPTIDPEGIAGTNAAWPVVAADAWCLAFSPRPNTTGHTEHTPVARSGAAPSPSGNGGFSA